MARVGHGLESGQWRIEAPLETLNMTPITVSFFDGRITIDPTICNGKPTIRGKRITVQTILEFLSAGDSTEDILHQYPSLEHEDIQACLRFAVKLMDQRYSLTQVA